MDLTLKELEYCLAIAAQSNITKAADVCQISQPALSKQLKNVEKRLGFTLFERNNRSISVTELGEMFLEKAQNVMDSVKDLEEFNYSAGQPLARPYNLGIIASSCPYILPTLIETTRHQYPELTLHITEGLTDTLVQQLKQGQLDFIIAATTFDDPQLYCHHLFFEPFLLAYNPQKGFSYGQAVTPRDINPKTLILLEDGHCLQDQTTELCAMAHNDISENIQATSLETILQMTAAGLGVSVVPKLSVRDDTRFEGRLALAPFQSNAQDNSVGRMMALYTRKTAPFLRDARLLTLFLRKVFQEV